MYYVDNNMDVDECVRSRLLSLGFRLLSTGRLDHVIYQVDTRFQPQLVELLWTTSNDYNLYIIDHHPHLTTT